MPGTGFRLLSIFPAMVSSILGDDPHLRKNKKEETDDTVFDC
jgi:hypothetical protein